MGQAGRKSEIVVDLPYSKMPLVSFTSLKELKDVKEFKNYDRFGTGIILSLILRNKMFIWWKHNKNHQCICA